MQLAFQKQPKDMRMVRRMGPRYRDVEPLWFLGAWSYARVMARAAIRSRSPTPTVVI